MNNSVNELISKNESCIFVPRSSNWDLAVFHEIHRRAIK